MMLMHIFGFNGMWLWMIYWLASLVFIVIALIDISHAKKDTGYKLIWSLIVIILGVIGILIYYIVEKIK